MFNPGDVVRLKHSTYKMTVRSVHPTGYLCSWFDKSQNLSEAFFEEVMLTDASVKDFNLGHSVQEE